MNPATIIRDQLGHTTLFMLGAKHLMSEDGGNTLRFKIGRNPKGVGLIQITLTPDDTYTVKFSAVKSAYAVKVLAECEGVYADSLHRTIEHHTGMVAMMPTMRLAQRIIGV